MEPGSLDSPGLPAAVSMSYQAFGRLPGRRRAREAFSFLEDASAGWLILLDPNFPFRTAWEEERDEGRRK